MTPKFLSPADPAARWTAAQGGQAFFAYCTNYLIDLDHAVIVDVEASTAVRQAEMTAAKTMIDRTEERFDLNPERIVGDTAYGSAEMLGCLESNLLVEATEGPIVSRDFYTRSFAISKEGCNRGDTEVPFAGRSGRALDGRTGRSGLLCLLHQLPDRSRSRRDR